ncbi:cysteine--tRNA ligase [Thalassospiraceae bacterium LMO-JJ14]|nr:cysteine--tRNA ligase [Thalassospiraceae bacterium LMO-JJ14]
MNKDPIQIHDTLTRNKRPFVPIDADNVRMYVCGPTVYDLAHVGNARPIVVFDVMARLLRHVYGAEHVTYVRNITDIDDKINARAHERGIPIRELTEETVKVFHDDIALLGALPPDHEPRATETIDEMQSMIADLIASGHAYEAAGHVLFRVQSMPEYGRLSRRNQDELIAGARVEVAPYKEDPRDFVLWKPSDPEKGEPGWDSDWGFGRPGWHIECSAMSEKHLGKVFDIHGGGLDLIFPHHENEIAQSRCAHGTDVMANYWMHNGYLMAEGEKMSKSLGNFYTVNELLQEFPGEAIRLLLLKTHYRQPLDFTKEGLADAKRELDGWYRLKADGGEVPAGLIDALCDDLNTPGAITVLRGASNDPSTLTAGANFLGLLQQDPEDWFKWQPKSAEGGLTDAEIDAKIDARTEARKNKDFATSDAIRDELQAAGVILEDGAGGTTWRRG